MYWTAGCSALFRFCLRFNSMLSVATFAKMVDVLGLKFWGISREKLALSHGNGRPERGQDHSSDFVSFGLSCMV
jgi:hypothetical protein